MSTEARLFWLMTVHTAVFALAVAAVLYALARGLVGGDLAGDGLLWAALAFPALIELGRRLNRAQCVLQTWARRLRGIEDGWARDVWWIPERWAVRVPAAMTPVYVLALGLCAGRMLERAL
ncbi:MAG TPA: hypothetical protein VD929_03430 [Caulobacteraceae bacterium]|nr:hypothetical protein [Caulobacteraceae bacterium]